MNTASTPKSTGPDIAGQIAYAMRSMGVSPIPRNYSLFYEAYIGSNPALTRDLAALGNRVTQEDLDELSARYGEGNPIASIDDAHEKLRRELEALLGTLRREQSSIENYNRILGETRQRIDDKTVSSTNILKMRSRCWQRPPARKSSMAKRRSTTSTAMPRKCNRCVWSWMNTSASPIPTR